jgi:SPP1 gp7 family putative phage head morphogenesis protein
MAACTCPHIVANLAASKALAAEQLEPQYAGEYLRNLAIIDAAEDVAIRSAAALMGARRRALFRWLAEGYIDGAPSYATLGRTPELVGDMLELLEGFVARCWVKGVSTGRFDVAQAVKQDDREGLSDAPLRPISRLGFAITDWVARFNLPGDASKDPNFHPGPMAAIEYVLQRRDMLRFFDAGLVEEVKAAMADILDKGTILPDARKQLGGILTTYTKARLTNVVRTESISAFNAGRLTYFDSVSHLVKGVKFVAIVDHRTTPICRDRNGLILPLSHPLVRSNTPPLHYQCRSVWSPVTRGRWEKAKWKGKPADKPPGLVEVEFINAQLDSLAAARPVMRGFGNLSLKPGLSNAGKPIYSRPIGPQPAPKFVGDPNQYPEPIKVPRPPQKAKIHLDLEDPSKVVEFDNGNQGYNKPTIGQSPFDANDPHPHLNGTKLMPTLIDADDYKDFPDAIPDPEWKVGGPSQKSTGVIVVEDDGRIWLARPLNQHGGYNATFPKGQLEAGHTPQQNALKETFEETGLDVEILAHLGDYAKTTSTSRYYVGRRLGGAPWKAGWESEGITLTPIADAKGILNHHLDKAILDDLEGFLEAAKLHGKGKTLTAQAKSYYADKAAEDAKAAAAAAKQLQREADALGKALADAIRRQAKEDAKAAAAAAAAAAKAQKAAAAAVKAANEPLDFADFEQLSGKMGSNTGGLFAHKVTGERWYLKRPPSSDHSRSEVLASKLYALAGHDVPEVRLLQGWGGELGVASRIVDGLVDIDNLTMDQRLAILKKAKGWKEGFATDAWLANRDTTGLSFDNMFVVEATGKVLRLDTGGALHYRAQGDVKVFNGDAGEIVSMRNKAYTAGQLFSTMKEWEIADSIAKVTDLKATDIRDVVYAAGYDDAMVKVLLERQAYLKNYAATLKPKAKPKPKSTKVGPSGAEKIFAPGVVPPLPELGGGYDTLQALQNAAKKVPGDYTRAYGHGTEYIANLRKKEYAAAIGQVGADKMARCWATGGGWQGSASSDGAWQLNNAWEWIHHGRGITSKGLDWNKVDQVIPEMPRDDDLVAALQYARKVVAAAFKPTKGKGKKPQTLKLLRGFDWDRNKEECLAAAALGKTKVRMTVRSLNCWSPSRSVARRFSGSDGVIVEHEFGLDRVAGGMALSPGFNQGHIFDDELEIIMGADTLNGGWSTHIFDLSKVTSDSWNGRTAHEEVEHMRKYNSAELDRIVKAYGGDQANLRAAVEAWLLAAGRKLKEVVARMAAAGEKKGPYDRGEGRLDQLDPGWRERELAEAQEAYAKAQEAYAAMDQDEIFDLTPMPGTVAARNADWVHYSAKRKQPPA